MKKYFFLLLVLLSLASYGQDSIRVSQSVTEKESSFKLYPNPAINDVVYITTANNGVKDIIIYDVFGELVLKDRIATNALNISKLVAGVYVLQVIENNKTMTRKLVVT